MEGMVGTLHELVYRVIESYIDEHHYPPSVDEIANIIGTSRSVVRYHMNGLFKEGRIVTDLDKFISRAYRLG